MARPEWRDPAKERFWRRMLREWRRSGLTGREFCAAHGLSEPSFYAWRREIAARDEELVAASAKVARRSTVRAKGATAVAPTATAAGAAFVNVAVPIQILPAIDVFLSQSRRLRLRRGFDADLLRQLLRVLEEPAC